MALIVTICCYCKEKTKCHQHGIETKCIDCELSAFCTIERIAQVSHGLCNTCYKEEMCRIDSFISTKSATV